MKPSEKLKSIRIEKGITTYELSELTGIPQSTISKMENDKRKIETESLQLLSKALQVPVSDFFDENSTSESNLDKPQGYFFERYLNSLGCKIDGDPSEGYIFLSSPNGVFEITELDIVDLKNKAKSFILYSISEIENKSSKITRKKSYEIARAAHNDFEDDEEQQKLMKEDLDEL